MPRGERRKKCRLEGREEEKRKNTNRKQKRRENVKKTKINLQREEGRDRGNTENGKDEEKEKMGRRGKRRRKRIIHDSPGILYGVRALSSTTVPARLP